MGVTDTILLKEIKKLLLEQKQGSETWLSASDFQKRYNAYFNGGFTRDVLEKIRESEIYKDAWHQPDTSKQTYYYCFERYLTAAKPPTIEEVKQSLRKVA